jgi:hypothetical protein
MFAAFLFLEGKEESSFSEEKEAKRLLILAALHAIACRQNGHGQCFDRCRVPAK